MEKERKEAIFTETGKLLIDVAKLVFGGVILAGIMKLDVNRALLFTIGGIFAVICAFAGIAFIALSKKSK